MPPPALCRPCRGVARGGSAADLTPLLGVCQHRPRHLSTADRRVGNMLVMALCMTITPGAGEITGRFGLFWWDSTPEC
jgi:hypothetical protein